MKATPMRSPVELAGRAASRGIFSGPIVQIRGPGRPLRKPGPAESECALLQSAITTSAAGIAALMETVEGEAAEMLAFQIAMLEDDSLSAPAFAAIARGTSAEDAWSAALDGEIAGYISSDNDYFRARAADLKDIRDRVLRNLSGGGQPGVHGPAIMVGEDMPPSLFLERDWSAGGALALAEGSPSSHVAMLARALGVPMVVGLGAGCFDDHGDAIVDGEAGLVILSPDRPMRDAYAQKSAAVAEQLSRERSFLGRPALTADGVRIDVLINVAGVGELDAIDPSTCDGIGLMRTEFLFRDGAPLPDEEAQYRSYRRFLEWAEGRPVTIRTLDIGGDKPIAGLTPQGEANPFLGLRGVRLTLARPDVFRVQLRALARAAVHGNLKVMIPMVTVPEELEAAGKLLDAVIGELQQAGIPCSRPPMGMMVEVPAAAIAPELFADAAFFSIGSNDLTQYVTASARDDARVSSLNDPGHPAVLRLIASIARYGVTHGIPVSLCGDMAGDPRYVEPLLRAGLRSLSVGPAALASIKAAIAAVTLGSSA
jgi:phosphotransferase system enzyme I (PtsI)